MSKSAAGAIKSADAFRTISEVADELDLPQHVLRFWETRFPQLKPLKRAGARRFYRPADVRLLKAIRQLLYAEGYTIKGVQRLLKDQGVKGVQGGVRPSAMPRLSDEDEELATSQPAGLLLPGQPHGEDAFAPVPVLPPPAFDARDAEQRALLLAALEAVTECQRILRAVLP